jgi:trehalose/maltose hydrolase-like predicted phosphorylase
MPDLWTITETSFDLHKQHHHETIFTIGNGYLSTRGAFEEGYPGDSRATFVHGIFDEAPIVFTELANAPDWLPFTVFLNGERFSMDTGTVEAFFRTLDLRTGVLTRTIKWISPSGFAAKISFERFASLADEHILCLRCRVTPDFEGVVEFHAAINGCTDNQGLVHWHWINQGMQPSLGVPVANDRRSAGSEGGAVFLHNRTRQSKIDYVTAMRLVGVAGLQTGAEFWDVDNAPTLTLKMAAQPGELMIVDKFVAVAASRDTANPLAHALERVNAIVDWPAAFDAQTAAWTREWEEADVVIEGDDEAQIALRFSLFQLLIAAPRHDDRVNIGAKTLSGFGYRGHAFWDTEIFMLPVFTFTAPHIAKNLLNYRYHCLPAARSKAAAAGFEGAWFAWESADTGEEVTPTWIPDFKDRTRLARVWTGDLAIHISADVAYAAHQYWQITGDDQWLIDRGAELILDSARFYGARAEWNATKNCYEYNDVIGPDEYHDHVNNNAYTNRLAQWNLQTALELLEWMKIQAPAQAAALEERLDLTLKRLAHWRDVIPKISFTVTESGLIEQFNGFFQLIDINLADYEPRTRSMHDILGIENANNFQAIKQPDVLMVQYLLHEAYDEHAVRVNYDYYTPRTDHTFGSSLGPSIQAILACEVGKPDDAYEHFIRAGRADLRDVRSNAGDGIHGASAGGTWQAVVFGFAGLRITSTGWTVTPRLPKGWKRIAFKFYYKGEQQEVDVIAEKTE